MTDNRSIAIRNDRGGGQIVVLESFGEAMQFAEQMSKCSFVPPHLRGKPADCLAITLQAMRWEMDPFSVAQKTYFVRDGAAPGYEAQLINAVILSRAPLDGRPDITWSGSGVDLTCTVSGRFRGDATPKSKTCRIGDITIKNSPLWKSDPQQQLAYFTTRAWARLYAPDVIMGVYTPDELREIVHDVPFEPVKPMSRLDAIEYQIDPPADCPPQSASGDAPADGSPLTTVGARPFGSFPKTKEGAAQYLDGVKSVLMGCDGDGATAAAVIAEHGEALGKLKNAKDPTIAGNAASLLDYAHQVALPVGNPLIGG